MNWVTLLLDCVVAIIGGCLGAALSALGGIVLFGLLGALGFLYLLVAHDDVWIAAVTGSVLLRPSVCFLGGVVAAAYARKKSLIQCGKDIGRPLASLGRPDILAVGGCAGLAGYLVNRGLHALLAGRIDTIALTVFLIPLVIKYSWRMTKTNDCEALSHAVPSPYRFFEKFSRPKGKTLVSLALGLGSSLLALGLFLLPETRPYAGMLVFFVSAMSLFLLFMGMPMPATHHFSGPAGATAIVWLTSHGGREDGWRLVLIALWGIAAAQVSMLIGDAMERLFFTEGDIHVDPPAMGIVGATAIMLGVLPLTGVYDAGTQVQIAVSLLIIVAALAFNLREKSPQLLVDAA